MKNTRHVSRMYHDICAICRGQGFQVARDITYSSHGEKRGWTHDDPKLDKDHEAVSWRTGKTGR
jgi:hypothetical protein